MENPIETKYQAASNDYARAETSADQAMERVAQLEAEGRPVRLYIARRVANFRQRAVYDSGQHLNMVEHMRLVAEGKDPVESLID